VTYRSDGGAKCAVCARGFSPDDLDLDVSGAWMCAECMRHKGDAEAAASVARGLRARRRLQLLGVALVAVAVLAIAVHFTSKRMEARRQELLAAELVPRIDRRLYDFRLKIPTWGFAEDRQCDLPDLRRRAPSEVASYVESTLLMNGTGWWVVSQDISLLLLFERSPRRENADNIAEYLDRFEKSGVIAVLLANDSSLDVGAPTSHWRGRVVLASVPEAEPLCWRAISVVAPTAEVMSSLTRVARATVKSMSDFDLRN
jgi:hypothetical protein